MEFQRRNKELQSIKIEQSKPDKVKVEPKLKRKKIKKFPATIDGSKKSLSIQHSSVILFTGRPNKGKTHAMRHLVLEHSLKKKDPFEHGIAFTRTTFTDDYKFMPEGSVVQGWDQDIFIKWVEFLEKRDKKVPNFIIFDDLVGALNLHSVVLNNFICNHRHYNTTIFICVQYINQGSSTTLRECVDYGIFFNTKTRNSLETIFDNFGQLFENKNEFKDYFLNLTKEKFTAMLFIASEDEVDQNYLKYLAPEHLPELVLRW